MNSTATAILSNPRPSDHIVYPYADDNQVIEAVVLFVSSGLQRNEAVLLVVTQQHATSIRKRLREECFDTNALEASGELTFLDARGLMRTFIFDGIIDEDRFKTKIGSLIQRSRFAGGHNRSVRVFGEMVDLMWTSNPKATLRLEQLWNEVIESHSVPLLCAYSLGATKPDHLPEPLVACHSHEL